MCISSLEKHYLFLEQDIKHNWRRFYSREIFKNKVPFEMLLKVLLCSIYSKNTHDCFFFVKEILMIVENLFSKKKRKKNAHDCF